MYQVASKSVAGGIKIWRYIIIYDIIYGNCLNDGIAWD